MEKSYLCDIYYAAPKNLNNLKRFQTLGSYTLPNLAAIQDVSIRPSIADSQESVCFRDILIYLYQLIPASKQILNS